MTQNTLKIVEAPAIDNVIRIGYKPSDLKGVGVEYLIHRPSSAIVARFFNGNVTVKVEGTDQYMTAEEINKMTVDKGKDK